MGEGLRARACGPAPQDRDTPIELAESQGTSDDPGGG